MPKFRRQKRVKNKKRIKKHVDNLPNPYFSRHKSKKQKGGFVSRYDFAYAGRDSVNQAAYHVKKIAPELINQTSDRARNLAPNVIHTASRELDTIAARRINQITR